MQEFFIRAGRLAYWTAIIIALATIPIGLYFGAHDYYGNISFAGMPDAMMNSAIIAISALAIGRAARYLFAGE